jgi:thiamine pyrophosphate-dependent acetolactate synthase large subunit-like protein
MGPEGLRVEKSRMYARLWRRPLPRNTVVLDFVVEREENVFPMVPAGGALLIK